MVGPCGSPTNVLNMNSCFLYAHSSFLYAAGWGMFFYASGSLKKTPSPYIYWSFHTLSVKQTTGGMREWVSGLICSLKGMARNIWPKGSWTTPCRALPLLKLVLTPAAAELRDFEKTFGLNREIPRATVLPSQKITCLAPTPITFETEVVATLGFKDVEQRWPRQVRSDWTLTRIASEVIRKYSTDVHCRKSFQTKFIF